MHPIPNVRTQVGIALLIDLLVLSLCGDVVGAPATAVLGVAAVVWGVAAAQYHVRRAAMGVRPSALRRREDRLMAGLGFLGIGVPLGACFTFWRINLFDGIAFSSPAAAVAGTLVMTTCAAVITSSALDWYVITPFQRGILNPEICRSHDHAALTRESRRRYAKWWIGHRGVCELIAYTTFSFFLAIVFTALTELVDDDAVLKISLGSFVGAGTAFALQGYLGPRIRSGWEYLNVQSAGLGEWAAGPGKNDTTIHGLVIDVSLKPGIQMACTADGNPEFVPLSMAVDVQHDTDPGMRCVNLCSRWIVDCDRGRREDERAASMGRRSEKSRSDGEPVTSI